MSFCFDPNAISLKRIRRDSVRIGGLPLDPTMNYTLVCKAFIAGGKDGYDALGGCKRLIDEEAADDIETVLIKFLDLANDKEIEEELIKQFKYDPKKTGNLVSDFVINGMLADQNVIPSPRGFPTGLPNLFRRKSSDMKKISKKASYLELVHDVIQVDGQNYFEIAPRTDGRVSISI